MLGSYTPWIKNVIEKNERTFSFLHEQWDEVETWKAEARKQFLRFTLPPKLDSPPKVTVTDTSRFDGLIVEKLEWSFGYGPKTEAYFFKPENSQGKLPGVLGLHDHGGNKFFGKSKITRPYESRHPFLKEYQDTYYGGVGWASELAKRGYGVLVHDAFTFESRKIFASALPGFAVKRLMSPPEDVEEITPEDIKSGAPVTAYDPGESISGESPSIEEINRYNSFAGRHEHIIAKSLFSAGLTWPGVYTAEDRAALDYLASREEIDSGRLACCGLSGGGLRTDYLAGMDDRISCSVSVGFMTTWKDFAVNTAFTHTWMIYIPGLSALMDFPDILSMRAPKPAMVMATEEDPLYTLSEVRAAEKSLQNVYDKAGSPQNFEMRYYGGPHQFDLAMQKEAFDWIDRHTAGPTSAAGER